MEQSEDKKNILIVDDDDYSRELIESFLKGFDLNVYHCSDGFTAIDDVTSKNIDILVLDVSMPFVDGFKLLEILKRNDLLKKLSIIMLTGSSHEKHVVKASKYGVTDYLVKPPKREDFLARIARILHKDHNLKLDKKDYNLVQVEFKTSFEILSLSEWGMVFTSNIAFPVNFVFEGLYLPFWSNFSFEGEKFKLIKLHSDDPSQFIYQLSFLGLSKEKREEFLKRL